MGYTENKKRCLEVIDTALKTLSESTYRTYNQYSVNGTNHIIDYLIINRYMQTYYDDKERPFLEEDIDITIIQYDNENFDLETSLNNEQEIFASLKKDFSGKDKNLSVKIIRIKEGQEMYVYAYLIPFLACIETSWTCDQIYKHLDFRYVICEDLDIDLTKQNGKYYD